MKWGFGRKWVGSKRNEDRNSGLGDSGTIIRVGDRISNGVVDGFKYLVVRGNGGIAECVAIVELDATGTGGGGISRAARRFRY